MTLHVVQYILVRALAQETTIGMVEIHEQQIRLHFLFFLEVKLLTKQFESVCKSAILFGSLVTLKR